MFSSFLTQLFATAFKSRPRSRNGADVWSDDFKISPPPSPTKSSFPGAELRHSHVHGEHFTASVHSKSKATQCDSWTDDESIDLADASAWLLAHSEVGEMRSQPKSKFVPLEKWTDNDSCDIASFRLCSRIDKG
jgi:hypothetical protein